MARVLDVAPARSQLPDPGLGRGWEAAALVATIGLSIQLPGGPAQAGSFQVGAIAGLSLFLDLEDASAGVLEYIIDEELCIGCAKCVKGCAAFGNGSLHLQVRHDRCLNCNECTIATA